MLSGQRVVGRSGDGDVDLVARLLEEYGEHLGLLVGVLGTPPDHPATVGEHELDLVDAGDIDGVDAAGDVGRECIDDLGSLREGLAGGAGISAHEWQVLGPLVVAAEGHTLVVERLQPRALVDHRRSGCAR